jgi:hypothetical protein
VLCITGSDDADFAAMLAFGASIIRLADVARHGGRAVEASELWPLITTLEARLSGGYAEPEADRLAGVFRPPVVAPYVRTVAGPARSGQRVLAVAPALRLRTRPGADGEGEPESAVRDIRAGRKF